jgi:hypothetical protein
MITSSALVARAFEASVEADRLRSDQALLCCSIIRIPLPTAPGSPIPRRGDSVIFALRNCERILPDVRRKVVR